MHGEIKKDSKTNSILSFTMLEIPRLKGFRHCFYKTVIKKLLQSLLSFSHCANHNAEQTSCLRLGKRLRLPKRRLFYSSVLQVFKTERTLENSIQVSFWPASITLAHFLFVFSACLIYVKFAFTTCPWLHLSSLSKMAMCPISRLLPFPISIWVSFQFHVQR